MPLDPIRVAETRAWLLRAGRDLRAALHDLKADPPLRDAVAFHCQQAAEKAMKALLAWGDRPLRKTHNLEQIGSVCRELDPSLTEVIDRAVPLTEYAWRFRYPGELLEPSEEEARSALDVARAVYDSILERLPPDVRP